ncbi:hypothetical protein BAE44_0011901 [Dichanthelium oligosanthes]|uniref:Uncharacterized protein n=1 Tax=Dichanthelium oligosanthes TaxID=888268 RepID=A0A1E5VPN1_9POAL|nr:hypothetical protein BAE44_0011901 [Dichanthelium oligosanthes]
MRVVLLTFLIAAMLCSASYCLGIWHNSHGVADSRVLGLSTTVAVGVKPCGVDANEPLDFQVHHAAQGARLLCHRPVNMDGLVWLALRGAAPGGTGVAWAGGSGWARGAMDAAAGKRLAGRAPALASASGSLTPEPSPCWSDAMCPLRPRCAALKVLLNPNAWCRRFRLGLWGLRIYCCVFFFVCLF